MTVKEHLQRHRELNHKADALVAASIELRALAAAAHDNALKEQEVLPAGTKITHTDGTKAIIVGSGSIGCDDEKVTIRYNIQKFKKSGEPAKSTYFITESSCDTWIVDAGEWIF